MLSPDQLATLTDDAVPPWDIDGSLPELRYVFVDWRPRSLQRRGGLRRGIAREQRRPEVVHPSAVPCSNALSRRSPRRTTRSLPLALAKAGEVFKDAAEGRPKVFDVALDTIRVALAVCRRFR